MEDADYCMLITLQPLMTLLEFSDFGRISSVVAFRFEDRFSLAKKVGWGGGQAVDVLCTWQLPWLAVEQPWSALAEPFLSL